MKGRFKTLTDFIADDLQRMVRYRKSDVKVKVSIKISGAIIAPDIFLSYTSHTSRRMRLLLLQR